MFSNAKNMFKKVSLSLDNTLNYGDTLCRAMEDAEGLRPIYQLFGEEALVSSDTNLGYFDPRLFIRKEWLVREAYDASRFKATNIDQLMVSPELEIIILKNCVNDVDLSKKGRSIKYNKALQTNTKIDFNLSIDYKKNDLDNRLLFDNTCWLDPKLLSPLGIERRKKYMPKGIQLIIKRNYSISQRLCLTYTSNEYLNIEGLTIKYKKILQDIAYDELYLKYFRSKADALKSAEAVLNEAEILGLDRE